MLITFAESVYEIDYVMLRLLYTRKETPRNGILRRQGKFHERKGTAVARVRIKDIAEQAGVSAATVSRYLNNTPGAMTDETRARIAEVVERTGYRPLAAARSLRTDRSQLLGVVLADISNPYSSAMLEALSREAETAGYSLMTAIAGNDPAAEVSAVERLLAAGADALVVNTCGGNDEVLRDASLQAPVVLLDRDLDGGLAGGGKRLDIVTSNNAELVDGLVEELVGCGCQRILLFTQKGLSSSIRRERAASFTDDLARRGVAGEVVVLKDGTSSATQVASLIGEAGKKDPLGLISINGLVFLQLVEALQGALPSLGEQAAARLHLATFDEYAWNRMLMGGVTTAAQDIPGIAAAIIAQALARIDGDRGPAKRVEIPGSIIRRTSTER